MFMVEALYSQSVSVYPLVARELEHAELLLRGEGGGNTCSGVPSNLVGLTLYSLVLFCIENGRNIAPPRYYQACNLFYRIVFFRPLPLGYKDG